MSPPGKAGLECHARPEVGVEVDVLDAADVGALVDVNPDLERAGKHVADQVQFVPLAAHVNRLVGIGERDVEDLAQLAIGPDGPGIGGHLRERLLGIMDHQVANHGVGLERNQRLAVGLAPAAVGQQHRADGMLAVGHAARGAAQRHARRDRQRPIQTVKPGGHVADRAVRLGSIQGGLQGLGVVGLAVALRAMLAGVDARSGGSADASAASAAVALALRQAGRAQQADGQRGVFYKTAS